MTILDLTNAPEDPIERILWLSGVMEAVGIELNAEYQTAYYEARVQQRFQAAIDVGPHSMKKALAFTRAENQARGRALRWGDGFAQG